MLRDKAALFGDRVVIPVLGGAGQENCSWRLVKCLFTLYFLHLCKDCWQHSPETLPTCSLLFQATPPLISSGAILTLGVCLVMHCAAWALLAAEHGGHAAALSFPLEAKCSQLAGFVPSRTQESQIQLRGS